MSEVCSPKKLIVGYQSDQGLMEAIFRNRRRVSEIYFPWGDFASGRGVVRGNEAQRKMEQDLAVLASAGLGMNLLLNGNCYGRKALSRAFFQKVGDTVDFLVEFLNLSSVTTTSPVVAKFLKRNFPRLEIRASVNMEIGTATAMEYLSELFDGFYLKRELNRDWDRVREARRWCDSAGKKLYLLANSGCLNFCPARTFHDNLVAHEYEIAEMDNAFHFSGLCHEFLARAENRDRFLFVTNFIRPEDIPEYEPFFDGIKLATRTSRTPGTVVEAYASNRFSGNVLDLTEPSHSGSFYPLIFENALFPADFSANACSADFCEMVQKNVQLSLERPPERKSEGE